MIDFFKQLLNFDDTMEVKNIYQDSSGKWHIDYSIANLMVLAIRVYAGQFLIGIVLGLPLTILISIASAKSIQEQLNIAPHSNYDVPQKSVCQ